METINLETLKKDFERDGYIFIPGFLGKEEVNRINSKLENFISEAVPTIPPRHVFYEIENDPETLKQLQDLQVYDQFFSTILYNSEFRKIAEILLEDKVIGKTLEYFNKPPKVGKPTPPHQDGYYFMLKPQKAVTMWMALALEDVDEENGCVRYIKGSHLKGMRPHGKTKTLGFSQGITDYGLPEDVEVPFPAKPGDLLIHHALTIHRADGNSSNRTRKAMGFIYWGESAREDKERKDAYMKTLSKDR